jgi:hypothetical protein
MLMTPQRTSQCGLKQAASVSCRVDALAECPVRGLLHLGLLEQAFRNTHKDFLMITSLTNVVMEECGY